MRASLRRCCQRCPPDCARPAHAPARRRQMHRERADAGCHDLHTADPRPEIPLIKPQNKRAYSANWLLARCRSKGRRRHRPRLSSLAAPVQKGIAC